jgi:hypothetical protein
VPDGHHLALDRLRSPAVRRLLERARMPSPESLAGYYAGPFDALRPIAAGAPLDRDDRPLVEYRAPRDLVVVGRTSVQGDPRVLDRVPFATAPPAGALFSAWSNEAWYEGRVRLLLGHGDDRRAGLTLRGAEAAGLHDLAARLGAEVEAGQRAARGLAQVQQAQDLIEAGHTDEGRRVLERAVETDPSNPRAWLILANQRRMVGDLQGADAALVHTAASPDSGLRAEASFLAGLLELTRRRPEPADARFREAEAWNPTSQETYTLEAQAWAGVGNRVDAVAALNRGLMRRPGDPELTKLRAEILQHR